ncbi:hypothetical protein ACEYYA_02480 [Paracoccus sp. p3-h83]|uniref:hypothetical protein n=1 Tax=Paracoccus sp. p3-h83 TaxID=3342805 RepID=UPI0035BA1D9D
MIISAQGEYGRGRLKKYAATSSSRRHTLVITVEYADATDLGWDINSLDAILKADRERDASIKAAASEPKPKALPKPTQLALPAPGGAR